MSPLVSGGIPLLRRSGVWNLSCMILSCPRSCQETDTVSCPNTSTLWIIPVLRLTQKRVMTLCTKSGLSLTSEPFHCNGRDNHTTPAIHEYISNPFNEYHLLHSRLF